MELRIPPAGGVLDSCLVTSDSVRWGLALLGGMFRDGIPSGCRTQDRRGRGKAGASKAAHKGLMWPPHSSGLPSEPL